MWNVSGALNYNHTSFVGSWNGLVDAFSTGVRYSAVALPQGTHILSATLSIYGGTMPLVNGPSRIRIYGEASDSAPLWADADGSRPDSIPFTTASVDFTGADPWTASWHQIDVTPIVQEIVNRGGWQSGNSLAFALTGADNRNYYLSLADSSQGAGLGPQLDIMRRSARPPSNLQPHLIHSRSYPEIKSARPLPPPSAVASTVRSRCRPAACPMAPPSASTPTRFLRRAMAPRP